MRTLALVVVLALVAGCNESSSQGASTSSDHGGYTGKRADKYDTAYATCYRKMTELAKTSPTPDAGGLLASVLLQPGDRPFRRAMETGCFAGANAAIGVSGLHGKLYETTSTP